MISTDILVDILSGMFMGGVLSVIHFGGLWLVLKKLPASNHPHQLFWFSSILRYAITLLGLYGTMMIGLTSLFSACAGLYLVRLILVPRLRDKLDNHVQPVIETQY